MTGTIVNVAAILAGGTVGLMATKELSQPRQRLIKNILGILTVWVGLSMTWQSLNGGWRHILGQMAIVVAAMILGKATGRLLRIQRSLNKLGQYARLQMTQAKPAKPTVGEGFITCALLFCVGPLAILGSLQDGLYDNPRTLLLKSAMDGMAAMAFARIFGWDVLLSAVPVLAYQGTLTLLAGYLSPILLQRSLLDAVGATGGLLIFCVALVVLELKRIELADYLPSLIFTPLLTWIFR